MSMSEGIPHTSDRKIALMISILALSLALAEMGGKSAQTNAITANIEASNLWAFFQAKTVRMTTVRTAADALEVQLPAVSDPALQATEKKRIADWRATAERYDNEPETQEGRRQLAERAKAAEARYAGQMARYHHFELASVALQIAIVLASTAVVTSIMGLITLSAGVGVIGFILMGIAVWAPEAVHFF
jgi:hypothetical protein